MYWKTDNNYFLWFLEENIYLRNWQYYYLFPTFLLLPEDKTILDLPVFLTKKSVDLVKSWEKGTKEVPVWLEAHGDTVFNEKDVAADPTIYDILDNVNFEQRCSVVRSRQVLSPDSALKRIVEEVELMKRHNGDRIIKGGKIKASNDWKYIEYRDDPEHTGTNDYLQYLLRDAKEYRETQT